jgi:hypothetical protein
MEPQSSGPLPRHCTELSHYFGVHLPTLVSTSGRNPWKEVHNIPTSQDDTEEKMCYIHAPVRFEPVIPVFDSERI